MTELAWTKWTSPPKKPGDEPALRPAWQRAGLCLGHLTLGVGLATFLLIARSRVVRILHVFPPSGGGGGGVGGVGGDAPSGKQLLVAGAHTYGKRGAVVPISRAHIEPGRDETEAILRIEDVRGHWWIGLTGARLRGTSVSAARMREALLAEWGIRNSSRGYNESAGAGRWKGGPIIDNR